MNFIFKYFSLTLILAIVSFQSVASDINNTHLDGGKEVMENNSVLRLELVDIDDPINNEVLIKPVADVQFPLNEEDKNFIAALKGKVSELGAAGLAAPQVGFSKRIIAFEVPKEALKWREDVTHLVPLTVLINPSYEPIEREKKSLDWEGCFSGKNYYGKIWRYKATRYKAKDIDSNDVNGIAIGFLARLLQHEIDHCNNKMCVHNYDPEFSYGSQADLMEMRKVKVSERKQEMGLDPKDYFPFLLIK